MASVLTIESGMLRGRRLRLPEARAITIGRDARCSIRIEDGLVSRVHCSLRHDGKRWLVEDRASSNGTYVNETPITRHALTSGDLIRVGESLFSFASQEKDPLVGTTVGGYRIGRRLGCGSMGTVYLAQQLSIDRPVAFKALAPSLARDGAFIERFLQEARAAGRLNHPKVVQVYDAGREGSTVYISMEWLSQGSLQELIDKETRLPAQTAVPMALDAAEALDFAERQGIVHRDIKPANLLLSADSVAKIGDLGIAADLRREQSPDVGRIVGSPSFMPPEQAQGAAVDHRADIYALGATLYRALSGRTSHSGKTIRELIRAKIEQDPTPLKEVVPEIPRALSDAVARMMARRPEDRYANAQEVHAALERALEKRPAARRSRARVVSAGRARARAPKGRASSGLAVTLVAVLLVLAAGGAYLAFRDSAPASGPSAAGTSRAPEATDERATSAAGAARGATTDPVVSPVGAAARDEAEAIRRLDAIGRAMREGTTDASAAEADLARVLSANPSRAVRERAEEVRELIADLARASRASRERASEALARQVSGALAAGDLRGAALAIEELARDGHDSAAAGEVRRAFEAAVTARVAAARERVDEALARGDVSAATAEAESLARDLPANAGDTVVPLRREIEAARTRAEEGERRLASAQSDVARAIARLDFARAREHLEQLAPRPPGESDPAGELRAEIDDAEAVWSRLDAIFATGNALRLELVTDPYDHATGAARPADALRWRVLARDGSAVRLRASAGASEETRSVFAVSTAALLELLVQSSSAAVESSVAALCSGLGSLLLYRHGPEHAREVLRDPRVDDGVRARLERRFVAAERVWLDARRDETRDLSTTSVAAGNEAPPGRWELIARSAAELLAAWPGEDRYEEVREELRDLYRQARLRAFRARPPDALFHAHEVSYDDARGTVVLGYDFSSEEQLKDFRPIEGAVVDPRSWNRAKRTLLLRGEVRLLEGDPFEEEIAVSGTCAAMNGEAPNINVALWTAAADVVALGNDPAALDLRGWRQDPSGEAPADYFVLAIGYRLPFDVDELLGGSDTGLGRLVRGLRGFLPAYLREPAYAILAGSHGLPLHRDRRELIWEMPLGRPLRGVQRYEIALRDKRLEWSSGGRAVPFNDSLQLDRLAAKAPHTGSVTFFTNGSEVQYSRIEVRGRLSTSWVDERVAEIVGGELTRVEQLRETPAARQ